MSEEQKQKNIKTNKKILKIFGIIFVGFWIFLAILQLTTKPKTDNTTHQTQTSIETKPVETPKTNEITLNLTPEQAQNFGIINSELILFGKPKIDNNTIDEVIKKDFPTVERTIYDYTITVSKIYPLFKNSQLEFNHNEMTITYQPLQKVEGITSLTLHKLTNDEKKSIPFKSSHEQMLSNLEISTGKDRFTLLKLDTAELDRLESLYYLFF